MKRDDVGIVIIEEKLMQDFSPEEKHEIEESVDPVFISISEKSEQESLRNLIKRSVGIDLWENDKNG